MDIIILAMVAVFIALRLYSVLGRHTGNEPGPADKPINIGEVSLRNSNRQEAPAQQAESADVVDLHPDPALKAIVAPVMAVDRSFDPQGFVGGAGGAYEMIIEAFAQGDRDTLSPLLGDDVRDGFLAAIDDREVAGQTMETKVVDLVSTEIVEAAVEGRIAEVTVRFEAEIISALRDSEDRIIDGNPSDVEVVRDLWTFARDVKSRDPNWLLVATQRED